MGHEPGVALYETEYEYEPPVMAGYTLQSYQHTPAAARPAELSDDDSSDDSGSEFEREGRGSEAGEAAEGSGDDRKWDADDAEQLRQTGPRVSMMSLKCVALPPTRDDSQARRSDSHTH